MIDKSGIGIEPGASVLLEMVVVSVNEANGTVTLGFPNDSILQTVNPTNDTVVAIGSTLAVVARVDIAQRIFGA